MSKQLLNSTNYSTWSQDIRLQLQMRRIEKTITSDVTLESLAVTPTELADPNLQFRNSYRMELEKDILEARALILNSMSPDLRAPYLLMPTAKKI